MRAGPTRLLPGLAGADFIYQWKGMVEYIPCYSGFLPATRLASRKILIEQNVKKRTGPALCVLCGHNPTTCLAWFLQAGKSWGGGLCRLSANPWDRPVNITTLEQNRYIDMCTVCTHPHGGPILEPGVPDPVEAAPEAAVLLPCTTRVHC